MQRINPPKYTKKIDWEHNKTVYFKHPLSSSSRYLNTLKEIMKDNLGYEKSIKIFLEAEAEIIRKLYTSEDNHSSFLRLWRLFEEELSKQLKDYAGDDIHFIPADTRIPDHTIWDHMDMASAIAGALERSNKEKIALLGFKLGGVQNFISHARKEEDLWAGSHMLSHLVFNTILGVVEKYGPDHIIFPYLKGQPFMDKELQMHGIDVSVADDHLTIANIPNRFFSSHSS
ncbi:MAG: type III-B CRISPR-associated protein Cas10/Cmr2 [Candidatus Asgardarchaeia archaeon]